MVHQAPRSLLFLPANCFTLFLESIVNAKRRLPAILLLTFWVVTLAAILEYRRRDLGGDRGIANVVTGVGLLAILGSGWLWVVCRYGSLWRKRILTLTLMFLALFFGSMRFTGFSGVMIPEFESRLGAGSPELPSAYGGHSRGLTTELPFDFPNFQTRASKQLGATFEFSRDWIQDPPVLLWRQAIGLGWGGFSTSDELAISLEERAGQQALIAYRQATGEVAWTYAFGEAFTSVLGGPGPRSTPSIADGIIVAYGPRGKLVAVDGADGSLLWSHDLMQMYGVDTAFEDAHVGFGRSNSPLIFEGRVVIPAGGDPATKQAGLASFGLYDGKLIWESPPRQLSYASPIIGELCGVRQIVCVNEDTVSAHDPETGAILWEHSWPGNTPNDANTSQPWLLGNDQLWISKGYGQGASVIQISLLGKHWKVETKWHNKRLLRTKFTSAVIYQGYAYGLSDGILECGDLATGKRVWKAGRYGHGQLLLVRGMLLVLGEDGMLMLIEATPDQENRVLGSLQAIEGKTWNHIALSGDKILVRNADQAAVFRWPVVDAQHSPE